jgi:ABC-2 type transport system ATP-binding protein
MDACIHFEKVDFSYNRKLKLLSDLDLQILPGHIHGLLGKNGEGKSTLLKLISGLLFPQNGATAVLGFEPRKRLPEMLRDVYFLAEELPSCSLRIADFERVYAPFYPNFSRELFDTHLKEFDIVSQSWRINRLSFGQKKKVMLAFALAAGTKILLMDEPTNGLDIPSKGQFRRMVASTLAKDRCIIISTHQVRDLDSLIDNIIVLENHKIVLNEAIETITRRLLFRVKDEESIDPDETLIYEEDTLRGIYQVCENRKQEDCKLDIELLFNAIYTNSERIQQVFHFQS